MKLASPVPDPHNFRTGPRSTRNEKTKEAARLLRLGHPEVQPRSRAGPATPLPNYTGVD